MLAQLDAWLSAPADGDELEPRESVGRGERSVLTTISDNARLERLRSGDVGVFEELFFEYATPLRRFVRGMVHSVAAAEDIVQDVFAQLWERRASVEVKTTLRSYLYAAARGRALTALRAAGVREAYAAYTMASDVVVIPARVPDALVGIEREELMGAFREALAALSPRVRQAAELRWFGKLSHAEVAEAMGTSPATVNNQLTTALRVLREKLRPYLE